MKIRRKVKVWEKERYPSNSLLKFREAEEKEMSERAAASTSQSRSLTLRGGSQ